MIKATGGVLSQVNARPIEAIQDLALRAMANDAAAYAVLNERLLRHFVRLAHERWQLDGAAAEQIAYQTVSEALQSLANGRYDHRRAEFLTFAYAVGRRVALRYHAEKRRQFRPLPDSEGGIKCDIGDDSDGLTERIEAMLACLRSPNTLTEEERFVVIGLAQQKTLAELAKELGRSLDTVHRRKTQGLKKLRECMAAKGFTSHKS